MAPSTTKNAIRIILNGNVKQSTVDFALLQAFGTTQSANVAAVLIDRSKSAFTGTWVDLGALLWMVPVLSRLRSQGNLIRLVLPDRKSSATADNFWSFLQRWRFFDILRSCVDDPVNLLPSEQRPDLEVTSKYQRAHGTDADGRPTEFQTLGRLEIGILPATTNLGTALESEISTFNEPLATSTLRILCGWNADEVSTSSPSWCRMLCEM